MEICNLAQCTGCQVCKWKCPKGAISMKENEYGVMLPEIDKTICVECGICRQVCQVNNMESCNIPQKCYAAWTKNPDDQENCSSGGIATGISREIIKRGGVVFGAAFTKDFQLVITETCDIDNLYKLRGSKYVQCDVSDSYLKVEMHLKSDREVLFIGTPCQIMGLRKFLGKDYDKLYLVDIVCHGVPPYKYLVEHITNLLPEHKVTHVTFRGKDNYKLVAYNNEQVLYTKERYKDIYYAAFYEGITFRENCYSCNYAHEKRGSDITVGDFWGINRSTMKNVYKGRISEILINTSKGEKLFKMVEGNFIYEERSVREAVEGNTQLRHPTLVNEMRKQFIIEYPELGFEEALRKTRLEKIMVKKNNSLFNKVKRRCKKLFVAR